MKLVRTLLFLAALVAPAVAEPPETMGHSDPFLAAEAAHVQPVAHKRHSLSSRGAQMLHPRPHTMNARSQPQGNGAPGHGVGRQLTVRSTAYCLRGFTARGTYVDRGTIAVDPRVIPMGSKLYIPGYGWGRALDTGGAIQGRVIDVWFPSLGQCMQWGNHNVTITVLDR